MNEKQKWRVDVFQGNWDTMTLSDVGLKIHKTGIESNAYLCIFISIYVFVYIIYMISSGAGAWCCSYLFMQMEHIQKIVLMHFWENVAKLLTLYIMQAILWEISLLSHSTKLVSWMDVGSMLGLLTAYTKLCIRLDLQKSFLCCWALEKALSSFIAYFFHLNCWIKAGYSKSKII